MKATIRKDDKGRVYLDFSQATVEEFREMTEICKQGFVEAVHSVTVTAGVWEGEEKEAGSELLTEIIKGARVNPNLAADLDVLEDALHAKNVRQASAH